MRMSDAAKAFVAQEEELRKAQQEHAETRRLLADAESKIASLTAPKPGIGALKFPG